MALYNWGQRTSPEFGAKVEKAGNRAVAVLLVGAMEQHGPHLDLTTDSELGEQLVQTLWQNRLDEPEVFLLPTLEYGASREHQAFPGTLSISGQTLLALVTDLGRSIARNGIKKLLLLSSHGGNSHWLAEAALNLREAEGMMVVATSLNRLMAPVTELPTEEVEQGIHGGAVEVALARALAPRLVRDTALSEFKRLDEGDALKAGGPKGYAWMAEDLSLAGVVGNTHLGTKEVGEALVARASRSLSDLITNMAKADWPPNGSPEEVEPHRDPSEETETPDPLSED